MTKISNTRLPMAILLPGKNISCDIVKLLLFIIENLFTLGLERKIYRKEMITAKDKKVTHVSHSMVSGLQARLRETSNLKNSKAQRKKRRKLAHLLRLVIFPLSGNNTFETSDFVGRRFFFGNRDELFSPTVSFYGRKYCVT